MTKSKLTMIDKRIILLVGVLLACVMPSVNAQHTGSHSATKEQTRQWLELQAGGNMATADAYQLPGPVTAKIYQRYLNSFDYPIPEYFTGDDGDASVLD